MSAYTFDIGSIADALRWDADTPSLSNLHQMYIDRVVDATVSIIAAMRVHHPELAEQILAQASVCSDEAYLCAVVAPETTHRVLWPRKHNLSEIGLFLLHVFAGQSRETSPDGKWVDDVSSFPVFFSGVELDVIHRSEPCEERRDFTELERQLTLERLRRAMECLAITSEVLPNFVRRFTKSILVYKRDADETPFASRSPERRIGSSAFGNPHAAHVADADLVEALVHESIHTVLDIDETLRGERDGHRGWIAQDLDDGISRVDSPWTGRPLALNTYLQACFVWYGLVHLWRHALLKKTAEASICRARLSTTLVGFLSGSLSARVSEYSTGIAADVLHCIDSFQEQIKETFE